MKIVKNRTRWSQQEKAILSEEFVQNPYLSRVKLAELAEKLGRDEKAIKNWFRNTRKYCNEEKRTRVHYCTTVKSIDLSFGIDRILRKDETFKEKCNFKNWLILK